MTTPPHPTCADVSNLRAGEQPGTAWVCTGRCPKEGERAFDLRTIRLGVMPGTDLVTATCLIPGCGWYMRFTYGAQYLATVVEVCEQHPHRPLTVGPKEADA